MKWQGAFSVAPVRLSIRNSSACNFSYTSGGKKLYHNAWPNAVLCMKAGISCNMFCIRVMALVPRLWRGIGHIL